jgi:hypothetical protein
MRRYDSNLENAVLASTQKADLPGFIELLEDVVDRARGRVKKEFGKIYRNVVYRSPGGGRWVKEIVALDERPNGNRW